MTRKHLPSNRTYEEPFEVSDYSEGEGDSDGEIGLGLDEERGSLLNYLWAR